VPREVYQLDAACWKNGIKVHKVRISPCHPLTSGAPLFRSQPSLRGAAVPSPSLGGGTSPRPSDSAAVNRRIVFRVIAQFCGHCIAALVLFLFRYSSSMRAQAPNHLGTGERRGSLNPGLPAIAGQNHWPQSKSLSPRLPRPTFAMLRNDNLRIAEGSRIAPDRW